MKILLWLSVALLVSGCAAPADRNQTADLIRHELAQAAAPNPPPVNAEAVNEALLPPLASMLPQAESRPQETRFDLSVNNTPVRQVFMAIVSGTRYSLLMHPDVSGNITLNLKDVTVFEALEAIHEMYGYDYKTDGTRIYILPLTLQTRIFQVNYLTGKRVGTSSLRVISGSVSDNPTVGTTGEATTTAAGGGRTQDSSRVTMNSSTDFWGELEQALTTIVGTEKGRRVVVSPMSGVIVVRAMPDELKNVATYLKASQISIERQVILEAKIIEVQLNDGYQAGVNWAAFQNNPGGRLSAGQLAANGTLAPGTQAAGVPISAGTTLGTITPGSNLVTGTKVGAIVGQTAGTLFGMAFQTTHFAALLDFLESQGTVHVLSSPRIATLNNQKAVLKVGTDEFFVTNVSTTTTTGTVATTTPSVTLQPFFSGIALDVTPRIDETGEIILHVHPSVSQVSTVNKTVDIGGTTGTLNLPLASSSVSETDSIVRARDGQIVAIGGLMREAAYGDRSGLPGLSANPLFGQTSRRSEKRELVILLKPTIVENDRDWSEDITHSRERVDSLLGRGDKP